MNLTRRSFLRVSGVTLATLAGWSQSAWAMLPGGREPFNENGPFQPPSGNQIDLIAHILNRTSFGLRGKDYARVSTLGVKPEEAVAHYLEEQFAPEAIDDSALDGKLRRFEVLSEPLGEFYEYKKEYLLNQMTRATLLRAIYSRRQLYEVMVQFWTDHFNIDSSKGECKWLKAADDRDVIRYHALGKFPDLLRASALSPAMLWYLDGRANKKRQPSERPNENYARELLELHTMGVHGGYTQTDVMEVARCLTGWTVRGLGQFQKGKVEFNPGEHDDGPKRVLGRPIPAGLGSGDLDRILEIVALHPATAQHVANKLCRRFIADDPPSAAQNEVAKAFLTSGGDIKTTLRALFKSHDFYAVRSTKFRRPFEYIVAALRACDARTDASADLTDYLSRMGHAPFQYPTPDGYSLYAEPWMSTLLWRWNFAVALTRGRISGTSVDLATLRRDHSGDDGLMAVILGRQATAEEKDAYVKSGNGLALLLAAPAFQYC